MIGCKEKFIFALPSTCNAPTSQMNLMTFKFSLSIGVLAVKKLITKLKLEHLGHKIDVSTKKKKKTQEINLYKVRAAKYYHTTTTSTKNIAFKHTF